MRASELVIVWPHGVYRRPPVPDRPDVRAAYELGAAHRQVAEPDGREGLETLDLADPDVRVAYIAALQEPLGPPSMVLEVLPSLAYALAAPPRHRGVRGQLSALAGMLALTWICLSADARLRRRRALALGLTRETAPVAAMSFSAVAQIGISLSVDVTAALRGNRRARQTAADALAAQIVRSVMVRRSWRRAATPTG